MSRKRTIISALLILSALIVAFILFREPRLKFNGYSTAPNGVSYSSITYANPEFYAVEINGQFGYIDQRGDVVIQLRFTMAMTHFFNGLARALSGGKLGFIDSTGNWSIQPQSDSASDFNENTAAVMTDGKWGYIDHSGSYIYPFQFDYATPFYDGTASVIIYEFEFVRGLERFPDARIADFKYIDMQGNFVAKSVHTPEPPTPRPHDVYPFRSNGLWGLSTINDEVIVPPTYDYIYKFNGPIAEFSDKGVRGYINYKGEVVWPKKD